MPCYDIDAIRRKVAEILDGPNSNLAYSSIWYNLQMKGTRVPREILITLFKELDPRGVQERRAHRLIKWVYQNGLSLL